MPVAAVIDSCKKALYLEILSMGLTLLDRVGEWNPQLFRELKGQLKPRQRLLVVASSLVCQFLLLLTTSEKNCLSYVDGECGQIDWKINWNSTLIVLNWVLPVLLLVCGTYLLISDLGKEERRGTLNFIRLSPQSSQSILLGKMLGVPSLLYLGIALVIPLHWASALGDGMPLSWLLGIYVFWGVGCCLFYTAACFYTLVWGSNYESKSLAGLGSLLACLVAFPYISAINFGFEAYRSGFGWGNWHWFWLPLGHQPELMFIWALVTLSVGTYWIWQAVNRLFYNSNTTLLSKPQSYWLVTSIQIWILGLALPELGSLPSDFQIAIGFTVLFVLNPIGFLILSSALAPRRQALLDWARYRHKSSSTDKGVWNRSLLQDLIWGEKSPVLVAIAINLLIAIAIWIPWIVLALEDAKTKGDFTDLKALSGLLLTVNVILIYAAITQMALFVKGAQRLLWGVGPLLVAIGLPLVVSGILGLEPTQMPLLWVFFPFPILTLAKASATTLVLGLLAQLSILGLVTLTLTRQLQKAGESGSKALFAKHSSLSISG
jgi:hypothetical protein